MDAFHGNEELLLRPLRISDIGETGMAILRTGGYQLLPYRDRSGRRIFTIVRNFGTHDDLRITVSLCHIWEHLSFVSLALNQLFEVKTTSRLISLQHFVVFFFSFLLRAYPIVVAIGDLYDVCCNGKCWKSKKGVGSYCHLFVYLWHEIAWTKWSADSSETQ